MDVINKKGFTLLVFILLAGCVHCFAQSKPATGNNSRPRFYFDNPITLDSLTKYVHGHSKIRFSFNSSKVKGSKIVNLKKGTYTLESLLQQIQKHTSLYYSMHNGYVIFQDNPPKQKTVTVKPPAPKETVAAHRKPLNKPINKTNNQRLTPATKPPAVIKAAQSDTGKTTVFDTTTIHRDSVINSQPAITEKAPTPAPTPAKKNTGAARTQNNSTGNNDGAADLHWQFGLQWKSAVPLYGTKYYFTGTNASSQPYNVLIPGAWVSALFNGKHEIMLLVKPAEWYDYNKKLIGIDSTYETTNRGRVRVLRNTRLVKTGNLYTGLQYNYHINEHLIAGAGIGYYFMGKHLVYRQTFRADSFGKEWDSVYNAKSSDTIAGKYLASSFITGKVEIAYSFGSFNVGATVLMPLTKPLTDKSTNKSHPLNVQIFIRWKIKRAEDE